MPQFGRWAWLVCCRSPGRPRPRTRSFRPPPGRMPRPPSACSICRSTTPARWSCSSTTARTTRSSPPRARSTGSRASAWRGASTGSTATYGPLIFSASSRHLLLLPCLAGSEPTHVEPFLTLRRTELPPADLHKHASAFAKANPVQAFQLHQPDDLEPQHVASGAVHRHDHLAPLEILAAMGIKPIHERSH